MTARCLAMCALAFSVTAAAQDTTRAGAARSDRKVTISKGEVVLPPRVDTVYKVRTDTVYATRIEREYTPYEVLRVDTVIVKEPAIVPIVQRGTLYGSFYTGMTMPSGSVDRMYTNGFHGGAMLGWDGRNQLVGFRLTADVAQLNRELGQLASVVGTGTPLVIAAGIDMKLMPIRRATWDAYAVGGGNAYSYRGLATISDNGMPDGRGGFVRPAAGNDWRQKWGFNVGGGLDFSIEGQDLFVEARAMAIQANGARTWLVPVSFGLRYF